MEHHDRRPLAMWNKIWVVLLKLVFETRFSYVGISGWKSEASRNPELLFAPERMEYRFGLFEKITLASLTDQTDDDFDLILLTSDIMPDTYKTLLREMCHDILGERRTKIIELRPLRAGRCFRNFVQRTYGDYHRVAQVVLDDDDAVSADFVEICKREAISLAASSYDDDDGRFLSFARGYSLLVEDGQLRHLSHKHSPYLNLGLTLVAPPYTIKNPFLVNHLAVGRNHPGRVINTARPFYLRTVHEQNDSRTPHKTEWISQEEVIEAQRCFPFLKQHLSLVGVAA